MRIWPAYFDIRYSRSEGRRVPRDRAIRDPKLDDLEKVSNKLGLNPIIQPDKRYSRKPWKRSGVVLVDKKGSKTEIIKNIAKSLRG
ncbi:signal recognition particle protein Srp19 [Candidatus Bathyarchaeota archaeon]|nr:signal recognition particle protein Srp19 [Candidatus Bathyarchaeota archaeon]